MKTNTAMHEHLRDAIGWNAHVLEIGAGEGTIGLAKLFRKVSAIEHDPEYIGLAPTVTYHHAPLAPYNSRYFREDTHWYDPAYLQYLEKYDAIIVDGPQSNYGRGGFATHIDLFDTDTLIYFDDVHRSWDFRVMGRVAQILSATATLHPGTVGREWFGTVDGRGQQAVPYTYGRADNA